MSTCPECNCQIKDNRCTNPDGCLYQGSGWNEQQRTAAWANHPGEEERTVGAQYDYTGREA